MDEKSPNDLTVREATREDFPMILMGAEVMWRESVYSHMDFNEEKLWARFNEYTSSPDKRLFLLERRDTPVGGLFASLGPTFLGEIWSLMKRRVLFFQRRVSSAVFLFCWLLLSLGPFTNLQKRWYLI